MSPFGQQLLYNLISVLETPLGYKGYLVGALSPLFGDLLDCLHMCIYFRKFVDSQTTSNGALNVSSHIPTPHPCFSPPPCSVLPVQSPNLPCPSIIRCFSSLHREMHPSTLVSYSVPCLSLSPCFSPCFSYFFAKANWLF